jgi:hypothetical protein
MSATPSPAAPLTNKTTFPITVGGLSQTQRSALQRHLSGDLRDSWTAVRDLVSTHDFVWLELADFISRWRPAYLGALAHQGGTSSPLPDGLSFSRTERVAAAQALPVRPYLDPIELADLLDGCPGDVVVPSLLHLTYFHGTSQYRWLAEAKSYPSSGYEFAAVGDSSTCAHCRTHDARRFSLATLPAIPLHIGCRCSVIALE